eukprot:SAG11_NODE_727_length_7511_cov_6.485159_2_plen_92_part_00
MSPNNKWYSTYFNIDLRKGSVYTAGQILDSYVCQHYTEFSITGSWYLLDVLGCTFASFIKTCPDCLTGRFLAITGRAASQKITQSDSPGKS